MAQLFMPRLQSRWRHVRPKLSPHGAMRSFLLVFESHSVFPSRIREALDELDRLRITLAITFMHAQRDSGQEDNNKHDRNETCDAAVAAKIQIQM